MSWKILFIIFALFLIIGAGCETSETKNEEQKENQNTENSNDQYYDNLDDALKELDELENN